MTKAAELLIDSKCLLGEGPFWHEGRQELFWFDIKSQILFSADADGGNVEQRKLPEITAAAAIINNDELAIATETGLKRYDLRTGAITPIVPLEDDMPANRTNDSRVHPSGAFWIGTMVNDEGPKNGGVYHYRAGTLQKIISDAAIPNATCFTADGRTAYWTDTPTQKILKCETDPETGLPISEWTVFADTSEHRGFPDGAVVDSEGYVWNARWGGSCVIRYTPDGSIDRIVEVQASQVTCPAFGGKDLKRLFLTSAATGLSEEQLGNEKTSGGIFFIDVDVPGLPEAKIQL
jgi:sugar lactone lactonase YvrE